MLLLGQLSQRPFFVMPQLSCCSFSLLQYLHFGFFVGIIFLVSGWLVYLFCALHVMAKLFILV